MEITKFSNFLYDHCTGHRSGLLLIPGAGTSASVETWDGSMGILFKSQERFTVTGIVEWYAIRLKVQEVLCFSEAKDYQLYTSWLLNFSQGV